ncbi:MAG: hypothetical protein ACO33A_11360, partial [Hyphomonas sp.]
AEIDLDSVPFAGGAASLAEKIDLSTWGEDYQLLFAAPPEARQKLLDGAARLGLRISRVGRICPAAGLVALSEGSRVNLPETIGFEHGSMGMSATRP